MTDFMSKAHALRNAVNWNSNSSVEVIAEALREEYQRGLEDAAKVADGHANNLRRARVTQGLKSIEANTYESLSDRIAAEIRKLKEARS